ncbi:MAG: hypothetical protein LBI13_11100 [Streptococcaceae bacterium]|jgi:hypothetical protein|nr:hypothetical protein [Streptococcaceae bacterium]
MAEDTAMIRKNRINKIKLEKLEVSLKKLQKRKNDFIEAIDLLEVVDDRSFIQVVSNSLKAPLNNRIYTKNLNGFRDDISELSWFETGQKYSAYWIFVQNFDKMTIKDGESGWSGEERKQHYYIMKFFKMIWLNGGRETLRNMVELKGKNTSEILPLSL